MGRRAKKAPVATKKRPTLAKCFKCPFCANEGVVECKMDNKAGTGSLLCRLCAASYQMPVHHLHEPIDVFSEWLDDCEAAANGGRASASANPRYQEEDDDDDDGDQAVEYNGGRPVAGGSSKKRPVASSGGSSKKQKTGKGEAKSFTDLGLDDSDDSDSD